jgi:hypothetical protein
MSTEDLYILDERKVLVRTNSLLSFDMTRIA